MLFEVALFFVLACARQEVDVDAIEATAGSSTFSCGYRKCRDDDAGAQYSFEEKQAYFASFLSRFQASLAVQDLMPALGLVLQSFTDQVGPFVAVDVGANEGAVASAIVRATQTGGYMSQSYRMHDKFRSRRLAGIICIEPSSYSYANLTAASKTWPEDMPSALWHAAARAPNQPSNLTIEIDEKYSQMARVSPPSSQNTHWKREVVQAFTLTDMILQSLIQFGLYSDDTSIFLLKIDCEGYDGFVLDGAVDGLNQVYTQFIIFETSKDDQKPLLNTLGLLWGLGFVCFAITPFSFVPISGVWLTDDVKQALEIWSRDIFCGNMREKDLVYRAIEVISEYSFPNLYSQFDYRQRQFVYDAIEEFYLQMFPAGPPVSKFWGSHERGVTQFNSQDEGLRREHAHFLAHSMLRPRSHANQAAALDLFEENARFDHDSAFAAGFLALYGHSSIYNRSRALRLFSTASPSLEQAVVILEAMSKSTPIGNQSEDVNVDANQNSGRVDEIITALKTIDNQRVQDVITEMVGYGKYQQ